MEKQLGVIVYLTQNTEVRKTYLKTSLYFLFRNFNDRFRYPVMIMHEGDYDEKSQDEVLMGIRGDCRSLVRFRKMKSTDFKIPTDIVDKDRLNKVLSVNPVPYWRSDKYRLMCRWWMRNVYNYTKDYKYLMRLDDDSIIEEPIDRDLFQIMEADKKIYMSNLIHVDCGVCCYGMRDFFENMFPDKKELHEQLFIPSDLPRDHPIVDKLRELVAINGDKIKFSMKGGIQLDMPMMFYNNFHVTSVDFWMRPDVQVLLDKIDTHGGIFYYRWGDAPLQSLVAAYIAGKEAIVKTKFKYSKRMQREAFLGDDKKYYAYMPNDYKSSSCYSERG